MHLSYSTFFLAQQLVSVPAGNRLIILYVFLRQCNWVSFEPSANICNSAVLTMAPQHVGLRSFVDVVRCCQLQLHPNCTRVLRNWRPELLSCFSLHCFPCQIIYQQCQRNEPCERFVQALNLSNTCCSNPNISVVRVIAQMCLIWCVYYTCGPSAFSRRFSFTPNKADWRDFHRAGMFALHCSAYWCIPCSSGSNRR